MRTGYEPYIHEDGPISPVGQRSTYAPCTTTCHGKIAGAINYLMLNTRRMKNYPVDLERRWLGTGETHQLGLWPGPEQTRRRM